MLILTLGVLLFTGGFVLGAGATFSGIKEGKIEIDPCKHEWDQWTGPTDRTVTAYSTATQIRKCKKCGMIQKREI